jgi:hypothetical protein
LFLSFDTSILNLIILICELSIDEVKGESVKNAIAVGVCLQTLFMAAVWALTGNHTMPLLLLDILASLFLFPQECARYCTSSADTEFHLTPFYDLHNIRLPLFNKSIVIGKID